jgi:DNA polymerase-3 subunit delta
MVEVLTGSNSYLLQNYLHEIIAKFTNESGDSIERFDGLELTTADSVLDAVRSVSFLEPTKMVIVKDFSQSKDITEKIESIVDQTADTTNLILVDPKLDKRTAMFKYLKKSCDVKSFDLVQPYELERWLADEAKKQNAKISTSNIRFLVERVGPNQQLLSQELSKLVIHSTDISRDTIEQLVEPTPQSKVFDMLDALFSGNARKAQNLYEDQRAQGEEPQKLLAMITWQLQQLTFAVFAPVKSVDSLVSAGLSPYSAKKALSLAEHISKSDLIFFITELAEIDMQSKTNADIESALAVYFSEIAERQRK